MASVSKSDVVGIFEYIKQRLEMNGVDTSNWNLDIKVDKGRNTYRLTDNGSRIAALPLDHLIGKEMFRILQGMEATSSLILSRNHLD